MTALITSFEWFDQDAAQADLKLSIGNLNIPFFAYFDAIIDPKVGIGSEINIDTLVARVVSGETGKASYNIQKIESKSDTLSIQEDDISITIIGMIEEVILEIHKSLHIKLFGLPIELSLSDTLGFQEYEVVKIVAPRLDIDLSFRIIQ